MFKQLVGNQKTKDFLKYWDFMTAMAAAPSFCNSRGMGKMGAFHPWLICKKELAAFFAVAIAFTNEQNYNKTQDKTVNNKVQKGTEYFK